MGVIGRPSLLLLTAGAASIAAIGNAVGLAAPGPMPVGEAPERTRLGVQIAEDLGQRDKAATRRGRALDLREQAVRAAEARLKAEAPAAQPATTPQDASAGVSGGPMPPADQYDDLARIYQAMKPAAAAIVLEQLDLDVQMRVAQKMRDRSTAMILAAMTPKGAAALTMALARRGALRPVPVPAAARR